MSDQILGIAISSYLGLSSVVGLGTGGPNGGVRRVECVRFRVGADGYEDPYEEDDEDAEGLHDSGNIKETFDVYFGVAFGGLSGEWTAKGLSANEVDEGVGANGAGAVQELGREEQSNTVIGWKTKFLEAQRKLWESQEESKSLKEKILEAVL